MSHRELQTDILIVGASTGGCAAAMAATALGKRAILTEECDWIGGQLTAQAVPPDDHPWIEQFGCTARYRRFRQLVRQYYRDHYPLTPEARDCRQFNPGRPDPWGMAAEPPVILAVLEEMLAFSRAAGRLLVLTRHKPVAAATGPGDRVASVTLADLSGGDSVTISAPYILDATDLGELLPLAGVEYVTGAESQAQTGEPHAVAGAAQPVNMQAITWVAAVGYDPHGHYEMEKPRDYDLWRSRVPELSPPWTGPQISWIDLHPITLKPRRGVLFGEEAKHLPELWRDSSPPQFFRYRQVLYPGHFSEAHRPPAATLINWPQNDYWYGPVFDQPADVTARHLDAARQLTLSLVYWLKTEAEHPGDGKGYPGLRLRPDLTGTADGLAQYPYIRESRRIRALFTITEQHVGADARKQAGFTAAAPFLDSVGLGCYRIDLHPSTGGNNYIDISSLPFQIPLGALIPVRVRNLLPACKNLGTTHITNGCYRLHPVEWNIGEAAGALAAFCLTRGVEPRAVYEQETLLGEFQALLDQQGFELTWPELRAV